MKLGTTRGSCETWPPKRGSSPDVGFGALSGKTDSNEKKNEGLFIGFRVLLRTNGRDETLAGLYPLIVPDGPRWLAVRVRSVHLRLSFAGPKTDSEQDGSAKAQPSDSAVSVPFAENDERVRGVVATRSFAGLL